MAALTELAKRFVVERLACFETPSEIVKLVNEVFNIPTSRQQIHKYDPEHYPVAKKWKAMHAATRKKFLESQATIAVAQKSYRLAELGKMYRDVAHGARPNRVLAAQLLEQAAKESGDAYTNKRIIAAADPIAELAKTLGLTVEQLTKILGSDDDGAGAAASV